jgi:hypothetical protein
MNTTSVPLEEHFWPSDQIWYSFGEKIKKYLSQSEAVAAMLDLKSLWK